MIIRQFFQWMWVAAIGACLFSCQKTGISDYVRISPPSPDTTRDIKATLAKSPFTLFEKAARRVGLDSLLPGAGYFTIFAPVDSAMQSAGLDSVHIASMSADTLRLIVLYHVALGAYNNATLTAAANSIQTSTLREDITYDIRTATTTVYQQSLFIKQTGALYINGDAVNAASDTAISASNGYIWPLRTVLQAPGQSIWQVLESRPELSMYLAGLRIDDSIYTTVGWLGGFYNQVTGDSINFNNVIYANQAAERNVSENGNALSAVFAPTNAAFAAAGFHTPADLSAYANRTTPGTGYDASGNYVTLYCPLDSVLKQHFIQNTYYMFSNLSLYNDFLYNTDINNGGFNVDGSPPVSPFSLLFSHVNNTVQVQWSPSAPSVVLSADKTGHFMTRNGVIYEINQLFYPHN